MNSPVDHAGRASLSEGEASGGVCGRFRIHGGRREGVWPACRGGALSPGPLGALRRQSGLLEEENHKGRGH